MAQASFLPKKETLQILLSKIMKFDFKLFHLLHITIFSDENLLWFLGEKKKPVLDQQEVCATCGTHNRQNHNLVTFRAFNCRFCRGGFKRWAFNEIINTFNRTFHRFQAFHWWHCRNSVHWSGSKLYLWTLLLFRWGGSVKKCNFINLLGFWKKL